MNHLINQLKFEMTCTDEEQAFRVRSDFVQYCQEQLIEIIDRICSKHTGENEWVRIDSIDIDLGPVNSATLVARLPEMFLYKFEKKLLEILGENHVQRGKDSSGTAQAELLKFFLTTGSLPWWAEESAVDIAGLSLDYLRRQPASFRQFLYDSRENVMLWKRLAYQLPREAGLQIILLFDELSSAFRQLETLKGYREAGSGAPGSAGTGKMQAGLIRTVLENAPVIFRTIPDPTVLTEKAAEQLTQLFNGNLPEPDLPYKPRANELAGISLKSGSLISVQDQHNEPEISLPGRYFVKHSGIVLIVPFLQSFFRELELVDGTEWKSTECRHRAIHLLNYLATGMQNQPEYNLILEKILCSTPIEEPVPLEMTFSDIELNEAGLLLESVIQHWSALKNTSVSGLRETFLKRDGIVSFNDKGWLVQVERKSWDVLIDRIPWGFSTLMLSWNDYIIYTEW